MAKGAAQFGMIGMAVMGRSLALNMADHGFSVAAWNLEPDLTKAAVADSEGRLIGTYSLEELVAGLERPRRLMMMIAAGKPVDLVLEQLKPLLDEGDIVIDGGNSWFEDTRRREADMAAADLRFIGVGVSGGEEGARHGPSMMPGGDPEAYERVRPVFEAIAAKTEHGPCVTHVGPGGAGHFVKMVHNGIEYADMQFIAEAYHLLRDLNGLTPPELAGVFAGWNKSQLESFLIEITARIFTVEDAATGGWLVDQVLDTAGQKGTGRWTVRSALDLGVPTPSIAAATDARLLSGMKAERVRASEVLAGPGDALSLEDRRVPVDAVRDALYASKACAYAQGTALIAAASRHFSWSVDLREMARIWTGGCIIRARFLERMMGAYDRDPDLENLLMDKEIGGSVADSQESWRSVVAAGLEHGVPLPGMSASLAYYDSFRAASLPQNLIQAQRDAFGAHTYRRSDDPDGPFVHSEWLK